MPSNALIRWTSTRAAALDELEAAHRAVGGAAPGRRIATQQINFACAVLLSAEFQGFCRDLHSEAVEHLVGHLVLAQFQAEARYEFLSHRRIDRGNANPGNIGADIGRLGFEFWVEVDRHHTRNVERRASLEDLNRWRNAISHGDFSVIMAQGGRAALPLAEVQSWRRACDGLAGTFDNVLREYVERKVGAAPW